jgi:peptidyl-prolyl cis-trans isomerase A (cyclophilin A)
METRSALLFCLGASLTPSRGQATATLLLPCLMALAIASAPAMAHGASDAQAAGKPSMEGPKPAEPMPKTPPSTQPAGGKGTIVQIKTNLGDITVQLDAEKAPITVENFVQYVKDGFFDGTIVHRCVPGFVIQAGGYDKERNQKATRAPIKNEWKNGLKNDRGTLSMARTANPDSATSQFFVNLQNNTNLDQPISGGAGYAVFGKVVKGMEVVDKIAAAPCKGHPKIAGGSQPCPDPLVVIESMKLE